MTQKAPALDALFGYAFKDTALLDAALTHPSVAGKQHYQRLEFMGDRVLGAVIAEALFRAFPQSSEGELAVRYNELVRRETLAAIAGGLGLGAHITMSSGEERSGGREKPAILADVCEALIGALFLDGGLEPARHFIETHWRDRLRTADKAGKDFKTQLQEWAQARGLATPTYRETGCTGPAHAPEFTVEVALGDVYRESGSGMSKRIAEQEAAGRLIAKLGEQSDPSEQK